MTKVLADYVNEAKHWLTAPPSSAPFSIKSSRAAQATAGHQIGVEQYPARAYDTLIKFYRTNPIVRRATKLCAESVAAVEPVVQVNGKETHPAAEAIRELMRKPNPRQTRFDFTLELAAYLKLSGNGWVEANPGVFDHYLETYVLRPERMRIKPGPTGAPMEFIYDPGTGKRAKYWDERGVSDDSAKPGLILHIKDFAPDHDWFGAGALEAADGSIAVYESAQTLARNMFDSGLIMSGILSYDPQVPAGAAKPSLTADQRNKLQEILDKFKLGKSRAGGAMIADAALKWVPMTSNLVDLQAEEIRNQAARGIANAAGVPPMLLGIPGDNTYANFQEASRAFTRSTVLPDCQRLFGGLARWYGQLMDVKDEVTIEVQEEKLWALSDEIASLWARVDNAQGLSIDERREAKGWEKLNVPGSNIVLVSAGLIPLEQVLNGGLPPGAAAADYAEGDRDGDGDGSFQEGQPGQHA